MPCLQVIPHFDFRREDSAWQTSNIAGVQASPLTIRRLSKRKCRLKRDEAACVRCLDLQINCSLNTSLHRSLPQPTQETPVWVPQLLPRSQWETVPALHENSSPSSDESQVWTDGILLTDPVLRREMVLWYFRIIHDKHHSLFHQPTFEKELDAGLVPDVILAAMVALGAR